MIGRVRRHTGRPLLLTAGLVLALACEPDRSPPAQDGATPLDFGDVPVATLLAEPDAHAGDVFEETFTFARIWRDHARAHPGEQSLDVPTHFTARIAASPLYIARIEFPAEADERIERIEPGQDVRLRVRFLRLHPGSRSPVFALLDVLPTAGGTSDLEILRR